MELNTNCNLIIPISLPNFKKSNLYRIRSQFDMSKVCDVRLQRYISQVRLQRYISQVRLQRYKNWKIMFVKFLSPYYWYDFIPYYWYDFIPYYLYDFNPYYLCDFIPYYWYDFIPYYWYDFNMGVRGGELGAPLPSLLRVIPTRGGTH